MPKPASFAPQRAKWAGSRQWKVELPAGTTPSGKRERMFFGTKQDASNFSEEQRIRLKNHGTVGMSALNVGQLAQAATAFETLKPYHVTLNEVVTEWITRKQASETPFTSRFHHRPGHHEISAARQRNPGNWMVHGGN